MASSRGLRFSAVGLFTGLAVETEGLVSPAAPAGAAAVETGGLPLHSPRRPVLAVPSPAACGRAGRAGAGASPSRPVSTLCLESVQGGDGLSPDPAMRVTSNKGRLGENSH